MKKIVFILILFSFFGWSQNTNFTQEQYQFVDEFYEKFEYSNAPVDEFIKEIEMALEKVPYHPSLVQSLLRAKFNVKDIKFMKDYCGRLDDSYLSTFQPILVDVCACAYFLNIDFNGLYHRIIPLIVDKETKELYLTAYYLGIDNHEEFIKYAKTSLSKSYEFYGQMVVRDNLFDHLVVITEENIIPTIIKDYEATIFSSELSMPVYYVLIQSAVYNSDFVIAGKLIDYVKKLDVNNYKHLFPIVALFYSYKGEERLAIEALEQAMELKDAEFEKIISAGSVSIDAFSSYSMSLRKIEDYKTRERLVSQAIAYFEKRDDYKIRFKLYQSLLYAPKDIDKARAILKECKPYLMDQNLTDLDFMIRIENELGKENSNYRLVDDFMQKVFTYNNFHAAIFQRILYRYIVNNNSKKPVFSLNEMVKEFDKLLKYPLDGATKLEYLRYKIILIGQKDREWAIRELEKLPEDEAEEIISDFESTANNSQKAAEILISNTKEIKDVKQNINFVHIAYINAIRVKK
ncbi:hypothetical protein [Flavobacterium orientale]|nr:hypothetical protein [Flavobacterium orientale]